MKLKDWQIRSLKTFVQAFFGILIPELCLILNNVPMDISLAAKALIPVVCSALAAGISACWNVILECLKK